MAATNDSKESPMKKMVAEVMAKESTAIGLGLMAIGFLGFCATVSNDRHGISDTLLEAAFSHMSIKDLKDLLKKKVQAENYKTAALIKDELERRKKKKSNKVELTLKS